MTRDELYDRAQQLDIPGRSRMTKEELAAAINDA
ncbi:Rho termination factor N-terminal domain-containing protein [Salinisphaera sp.]|nr:Rho termination factor N-terminal domain-containing protein [Salinisphaera sp.]